MSIDDVTIPWPEEQSPFFPVGRLTVEHQLIHFEEQRDFCENLTFAPWNGLEVHRPVGALNRLRRVVYPLVAAYRHEKQGVRYEEPTGHETFGWCGHVVGERLLNTVHHFRCSITA